MTDTKRKEEIQSITKELKPLHHKLNILSLKVINNKNYSEEEIQKMKNEIQTLQENEKPKLKELKSLKCLYEIEYKGKFSKPLEDSHNWETFREFFYLINCAEIDTITNGWDNYLNEQLILDLISEIRDFIYLNRFTHFEILNIRRVN